MITPGWSKVAARYLLAIGAACMLAGCADKLVSDDEIRSKTALVLDVPESAVVISHRRYDGQKTTYYDATIHGHLFKCVISGGDALDLGRVSTPVCGRPGDGMGTTGAAVLRSPIPAGVDR